MALNPYFNKFKNLPEQNLMESLIIEDIKIHGMELFYVPRTMVNRDDLFGEAPYSRFEGFKMIEMYLDSSGSFEGGDIFTKFGLEIRDTAHFSCSKKRFKRETGMERPIEGDLLYMPLTRSLLEIKFVEHENPFYKLGKLFVFRITTEKFQYSEEDFATGVPEIDVVSEDAAYRYDITVGATSGTGSFAKGDLVYQWSNGAVTGGISGSSAKATVLRHFPSAPSSIVVADIVGSWAVTGPSGGNLTITKSDGSAWRVVQGIDEQFGSLIDQQNAQIEEEADGILDFSERHPFGEP